MALEFGQKWSTKMNTIGLFFVTPEGLLVATYDKKEGERKGGLLIPPHGHEQIWRERFEKTYGEVYDFYPRGRVVFNIASRQYVIYHDRCIKPMALRPVVEAFGLGEESVRQTMDIYYDCARCKHLFDDDWD
ncbi:MAG: hypothetical protein ACRCW2_09630 [Cellulosilyticaceae bacterium]